MTTNIFAKHVDLLELREKMMVFMNYDKYKISPLIRPSCHLDTTII